MDFRISWRRDKGAAVLTRYYRSTTAIEQVQSHHKIKTTSSKAIPASKLASLPASYLRLISIKRELLNSYPHHPSQTHKTPRSKSPLLHIFPGKLSISTFLVASSFYPPSSRCKPYSLSLNRYSIYEEEGKSRPASR